MKNKLKLFKIAIPLIFILFLFFLYTIYVNYRVDENFYSLPLSFNPYTSTSTYNWNDVKVQIRGGFVKGKMLEGPQKEILLLRSLAPNSKITLTNKNSGNKTCFIQLENINPIKITTKNNQRFKIVDSHTISFAIKLKSKETRLIDLYPEDNKDYFEFVNLGDNRNGYKTFSQIIEQINGINPVFAIDNGDLVFGGEPNKYRLFYETVSKLQVPLYTTLGNHDIRENGRKTYTKLFGPPYYSFDYRNSHFVFLDSSRGWAEKRAIPEEQYRWLESDLQKAKGKRIYVISHIPPTDPRSDKKYNPYPNIPGVQQTGFFEREMNNYILFKNLDHSFPDKKEAKRFENLMSSYKVDTVFLSHIHSYFSFLKDGVRYIISGGAGAELLTPNSYYHYMRVKVTNKEEMTEIIQLPSPTNQIQDRVLAGIQLFASSIFKEYKTYVIAIASVCLLTLGFLLWKTRFKWVPRLRLLTSWSYQVVRFAIAKYKKMQNKT